MNFFDQLMFLQKHLIDESDSIQHILTEFGNVKGDDWISIEFYPDNQARIWGEGHRIFEGSLSEVIDKINERTKNRLTSLANPAIVTAHKENGAQI